MNKKYIVRLTDAERRACDEVVKKLKGTELALDGVKPQTPPTPPLLDGEGEAKVIATRLGNPPAGYGRWTLRLLAEQLVALEIVESISHETVRQILKKRDDETQNRVLGDSSRRRRGVRRTHGKRVGSLCKTLRSAASGGLYGRATGAVDW
jgi:hypothetical protein